MTDNALVVRQSISLITEADHQAAAKIKMLLPYGNKLTDDNAIALAAYSRLHGLDPFNGECYFLVREKYDDNGKLIKREELGVYPGIRGKRKLAKKQLQDVNIAASYRVDYIIVGPDAVGLKSQPGEIAIVVQADLRDTESTSRYIGDTIKLKDAGIDYETIKTIMGKPPVWTGFGVVKTNELRYIKQSPVVLAKKRAESDATNQRFDLPFSDDALADDIAPEIIGQLENGVTNDSEPVMIDGQVSERKNTMELAAELGFDMPPDPQEYLDTLRTNEQARAKKVAHADKVPSNGGITLDMAKEVVGSDGKKYGECSEKELDGKMIGITRKLNIKNLDEDEREELLYKLDAIDVLLKDITANQPTQGVPA